MPHKGRLLIGKQMLSNQEISDLIVNTIKKRKPETVDQLIAFLQADYQLQREEILEILTELEEENRIRLNELMFLSSARDYLFSSKVWWYWAIILLSFLDIVLASFFGTEISAAYFGGLILVIFFMAVYFSVEALSFSIPSHKKVSNKSKTGYLILCICLSLAVAPLFSLLSSNISLVSNSIIPINLFFVTVTIVFSSIVVWREYLFTRFMLRRRARKNDAYFIS
jgi:hypothetical protein